MEEPTPIRTFRTPEEAEAFVLELEGLGFAPVLEDNRKFLSGAILGAVPDYFVVKLPSAELLSAEAALEDAAEKELAEVPQDHYLFSFSDDELQEIVRKPDEWNAMDRKLARRLLAERGQHVPNAEVLTTARIEELAEPADPQTIRVLVGYVCVVLFPYLAVFIGYHLNTAKKTLPDGRRVYVYNGDDRSHGKWIFFIGIVTSLITVRWLLTHLEWR